MMIAILIYVVSWLILLGIYLGDRLGKNHYYSREPWYVYAAMIVGAPLCVLYMPYLIYQYAKDRKEERRRKEMRERREEEERQHITIAQKEYQEAAKDGNKETTDSYVRLAQSLREAVKKKEYQSILGLMDKARLPGGHTFGIRLCEMGSGLGDESKPYVQNPSGKRSASIFEFLRFEDSCMGAWQAFLLHQMWHYLPLWWHANYARRQYIYSLEDVSAIDHHPLPDLRKGRTLFSILSRFDGAPEVFAYNGKYFISCCFWTEFGGLIREYAELIMKEGKLDSFSIFGEKTLLEYNCGIRY